LTNGSSPATSVECGAARASSEPASVEMATAPMLIQYGGARSDGLIAKNR
jgi:hypothetical protein